MVEKIVAKLIYRMEERKIIERTDCEYYEYVLVSMAERVIAVGSMLIIGIFFRQFIAAVFFLIFFLPLRERTGGYHADKFYKCYLMTIITYIGIVRIAELFSKEVFVRYVLLFISLIIIWVIGTVNHPNMDLSNSEICRTRKAARQLLSIEMTVIIIADILKMNVLYTNYMSLAVILCSFLMCLAKILKQEVRR